MFGKLIVAVVALATAAIFFIYLKDPYSSKPSQTEPPGSTGSQSVANNSSSSATQLTPDPVDSDNPFAANPSGSVTEDTSGSTTIGTTVSTQIAGDENLLARTDSQSVNTSASETLSNLPGDFEISGVSIYDVGRSDWESDAQFEAMQAQLAANPELLNALLEQMSAETDPQRLRRLTQLIGKLDNGVVTSVARDMLDSGNPEAQLAALDLLRQTQANNSLARDLLVDVISAEQDPRVLNVALNAFASPGSVSSVQRQGILNNVADLAEHYDANVRARSYSLLATWTDTAELTPIIVQGLSDPDPGVRSNVAHSLLGYDFPDDSVRAELIRVAENPNEERSTRQASLHALGRMSLTEDQRARLRLANQDVSRAPNR